LTASKPNAIRRRIRKCSQRSRQIQVVRALQGQWGLTIKQIARRLRVSTDSVRRYLPGLIKNKIIIINFKQQESHSKKPIPYYALKRTS
jgi:DNA-binding transcriptional regulator LsrR (DeoR family)